MTHEEFYAACDGLRLGHREIEETIAFLTKGGAEVERDDGGTIMVTFDGIVKTFQVAGGSFKPESREHAEETPKEAGK